MKKKTINWNKFEPKVILHQQNWYLDFLISPSFHGVNRLEMVVEQVRQDIIFHK